MRGFTCDRNKLNVLSMKLNVQKIVFLYICLIKLALNVTLERYFIRTYIFTCLWIFYYLYIFILDKI